MNKYDIELTARELQIKIWKQKDNLWPSGHPHLTQMFEPAVAAKLLNVHYEEVEELGRFGLKSDKFEVAGIVNRLHKSIEISNRFPNETKRFTGAHEIGHWLLHPKANMHRDRPINGLTTSSYKKEPIEVEADYFAACFLMPKKLVINCLEKTFKTTAPFEINDTTAFNLYPSNPNSILCENTSSIKIAMKIASATSFGMMHFISLAQQFNVSMSTMAIRLIELKLIK